MMTIFINGESRDIEDSISLDRLLDSFSMPKQRVAVELNREVVRKKDWHETTIGNGDRLEVIHFVGGG
ncbi:MAG: sulfur carrier protein ThiS [Blastocatellia bacterium]